MKALRIAREWRWCPVLVFSVAARCRRSTWTLGGVPGDFLRVPVSGDGPVGEVREVCRAVLPGAVVRRHLLWRYSIVWRKP